MKRSILVSLILAISLSIMGCGQKAVTIVKDKESSAAVTKPLQTEVPFMTEQRVKDFIFTINTFKGDASPNNVRELYTKIKPMLSVEEQAIYEKVNIEKFISARKFNKCDFISWMENPSMEYNGKGHKGYTIYCLVEYIEESTQKAVRFKTESDIIDYNGKLLLIRDKDIEEIVIKP